MPLTMSRINVIKGLGPVMQIAEVYTAELPDIAHNAQDARTSPTWPTTWFVPIINGKGAFKDRKSVV